MEQTLSLKTPQTGFLTQGNQAETDLEASFLLSGAPGAMRAAGGATVLTWQTKLAHWYDGVTTVWGIASFFMISFEACFLGRNTCLTRETWLKALTAEIIGLGGESILLNGHVDELSSKYLHPYPRISAVFSLGQGSCSLQQAMVSLETCLVRVV